MYRYTVEKVPRAGTNCIVQLEYKAVDTRLLPIPLPSSFLPP